MMGNRMSTTRMAFLDHCWALSLGCSAAQLRDGGRHVVASPQLEAKLKRPYPLSEDAIAFVTYGRGWVLSVPAALIEMAREQCSGLSFREIAHDGDEVLLDWFGRLGTAQEIQRPEETAYRPLRLLAEPLKVRGWSHYLHWYCDGSSAARMPMDRHVIAINRDRPEIWEQWLKWPGPVGGPGNHGYFEVSDAFGYILEGQLVSAAQIFTTKDEFAWEFGPSTLPDFRRRGFATEVCRAATQFILEQGQIPWYYYDHYNVPSARIPEKLGYSLYSEGLFSHNS